MRNTPGPSDLLSYTILFLGPAAAIEGQTLLLEYHRGSTVLLLMLFPLLNPGFTL